MSETEVLKEFLARLGFVVDERSFNKFNSTLEGTTKKVFAFGAGIAGVAATTEAFAFKMAESLDKLYFASKRTGSTAGEIGSYDYAISQLGGTAEGAQGSLENLAQFMRENYADGLLTGLFGVKPEHLKDTKKAMDDIAVRLQSMNANGQGRQAFLLSHMIGLDNNTAMAMMSGEFTANEKEYNEVLKQSGVDLDAAAEKGHLFSNEMGKLGSSLTILADGIAGDLIPYVHTLNKAILDLAGATQGAGNGSMWDNVGDMLFQIFEPEQAHTKEEWKKLNHGEPLAGTTTPSGAPVKPTTNVQESEKSIFAALKSMGWNSNQASGILANLQAESGLNPKAEGDNGQAYGIAQWHPDRQKEFAKWSGHDIHSSTLGEQLQFMQYELTQGMYSAAGDALKRSGSANEAGVVISSMYERPKDMFGQATLRGGMAERLSQQMGNDVTINQNTTVNVSGEGNPAATGQSVAGIQRQVNQDLVRNVIGAVR
jgi:hypothetical protein